MSIQQNDFEHLAYGDKYGHAHTAMLLADGRVRIGSFVGSDFRAFELTREQAASLGAWLVAATSREEPQ